MKNSILLATLVLCSLWGGAVGAAKESKEAINSDMKQRLTNGVSFAPIIGADPTYGVILGGAFFRGVTDETPMQYLESVLYGTPKGSVGAEAKLTMWDAENMFYRLELQVTSFYDNYFGEGGDTNLSSKVQLDAKRIEAAPSVWWRIDRRMNLGIVSEIKYRNEKTPMFGNAFSPILGVAFQYDGRDHQVLSKEGNYFQARLDTGPSWLSDRSNNQSFVRLDLDARHFTTVAEGVVLAGQLGLGTSLGDPGYLYRFNLGGSRRMRGYQSNRLRGDHYYFAQGEARIGLLSWLGVVGFVGIGDTANTDIKDFTKPKLAGGGGLRIGLPPDFVAKARIDFGYSKDEFSIYLNFNEAF